jgi:hypothetical protein
VQLLRHILLFPEQLSAQCCLQTAGSKANAGTDQTTRLSKATTETSLGIVASLLKALSLVAPYAYFYPKRDHSQIQKAPVRSATGRKGPVPHFQWLTKNIGYPKLREHLGAVVATMKLSLDWHDFKTKLDQNYPRVGKPTQLSFDYANEEAADTGKGL